jgi:hypothetical protein
LEFFDKKYEETTKEKINIDIKTENEEIIKIGKLYSTPSFEEIETFDSEDLNEDSIYILLPDDLTLSYLFCWIGDEADKKLGKKYAEEFKFSKNLGQDFQIKYEYEFKESKEFFQYFSNG